MRPVIEIVAERLGATFEPNDGEFDQPGCGELCFDTEDIYYPVPEVVSQEDAMQLESQLRDLVNHERDFRRKWLSK